MSLREAFASLGSFLGITLGAVVLNIYKYEAVGIFLGALNFASITVVLLFAKSPNRTSTLHSDAQKNLG
jgi:predicted MFS family arabinose efflux permease